MQNPLRRKRDVRALFLKSSRFSQIFFLSTLTACLSFAVIIGGSCTKSPQPEPIDDAGGRTPADFPELAEDVFAPMDDGVKLSAEEIKGRNTWNLWCGGNEQFWDHAARISHGLVDLLRMLDSRQRGKRFTDLGLINQPGYKESSKPDAFGLYLDEATAAEPASIDPKVYGRASGVMGFRIFDNPEFTGDAVKNWDANKFYNDPNYSADPKLVRPYRIGVACGSCHIAFNPCNPPADVHNPNWDNLASAIGNQYIREGFAFAKFVNSDGFLRQMFQIQPAGTSDTSRIATDHINNPNAINPIFRLGARLAAADVAPVEKLAGETLHLPGVTEWMHVPHVLKDGADSVGVPGATLRVYINIGLFSQHWLQQHNPLIGIKKQKPFSIDLAKKNSVYWRATETKFPNIANFFKRIEPYRLEKAKGGEKFITKDAAVLKQGKLVFAANCAECHSSKRPPADLTGDKATEWYKTQILTDDFEKDNFFSDDQRHPMDEIGTNSARACGTNAMDGHVWSNFSSVTYKNLPSVGKISVLNPFSGETFEWKTPNGGAGYYRTPSLISIWTSAPFFHNNALGLFNGDPSVEGRMKAFDDAVQKLLWPKKRDNEKSIWRTTKASWLQIPADLIPEALRALLTAEGLIEDNYFKIAEIPRGTPINLLTNINPDADPIKLVKLFVKIKKAFLHIKINNLEKDEAALREYLKKELAADLYEVSKCPDFVEDRGHTFGENLSDSDKNALIEYLKTL